VQPERRAARHRPSCRGERSARRHGRPIGTSRREALLDRRETKGQFQSAHACYCLINSRPSTHRHRVRPYSAPSTLPLPGRARWGVSGSLNPKSAPCGPNAAQGAVSSGLDLSHVVLTDRVPRTESIRTASGEGSSANAPRRKYSHTSLGCEHFACRRPQSANTLVPDLPAS